MYTPDFISFKKYDFFFLAIPHLALNKENKTLRKKGKRWEQRMWGLRGKRTNKVKPEV